MEEVVCSPAAGAIDSVGSSQKIMSSEGLRGVVQEVVVEPCFDCSWLADGEVEAEESSCGFADGLPKEVGVQGYTAASNPGLEAYSQGAADPEDTPRGFATGPPS